MSGSSLPLKGDVADGLVRSWRLPLALTGLALIVLFLCYWSTLHTMLAVWQRSETFTHGYLVFPISLWLIWRCRSRLAILNPRPDWRGLLALVGLGFGWLLANVVDVLVIQQLSFVAMIIAVVWSLLGVEVARTIAFPLGFLFFAVPIGEFLIPPLMNFTADFTVALIRLSGIPVYREGTFFSIPSGDWSVVEGCSGLRYLIASVTLGCLYAYLNYRSLWRRLAFIALSIFFPIIANGFRAYMIVMIAHLSDMRLALGVDHYIYGWVFFGLVMLLMFWIGSLWYEKGSPESPGTERKSGESVGHGVPAKVLTAATFAVVVLMAVWPVWAFQIREAASARAAPVTLRLPQGGGGWHRVGGELTAWQPRYLYPDARASAVYSDGRSRVVLYLFYYRTQVQGKELINSQNVLIPQKHPVWKMPWEKAVAVSLEGRKFRVREGILESAAQKLLVWRWNWLSGRFTINDHLAKLLEARDKLIGHPRDAAGVVVVVEYDDLLPPARQILRRFTEIMLPEIRRALAAAEASG